MRNRGKSVALGIIEIIASIPQPRHKNAIPQKDDKTFSENGDREIGGMGLGFFPQGERGIDPHL